MEKLYRSAFICGLIPLLILAAALLFKLSTQNTGLETLLVPILIVVGILVLVGSGFLYAFFSAARARESQRNMTRALIPLALLVTNIPLAVVTYLTTHFSEISNTIIFENNSSKAMKKIFLTNGNEKYFIAPVEPNQRLVKAIAFKADGKVEYTFTLDKEVLNGILLDDVKTGSATSVTLTVSRTERVVVKDDQ